MTKPRTCGACGETGHNRRTCPGAKPTPPPPTPPPPKPKAKVRTCGACGETGHNRRTCPQKGEASPKEKVPAEGIFKASEPTTEPPTPEPVKGVSATTAFHRRNTNWKDPSDLSWLDKHKVELPKAPKKGWRIKRSKSPGQDHPIGKEPHLAHYKDKEADHRRWSVKIKKTGEEIHYLADLAQMLYLGFPKRTLNLMRWEDMVNMGDYIVTRIY